MNIDPILREQRARVAFLRDRFRKNDDRNYDPDIALLRNYDPFFPRFTGHTRTASIWYAVLLLLSDDRTYGTDDAGEANRIIHSVLEGQDLGPDSETFGNFFWMTHWDRVKDRNAVSFITIPLVCAYLDFQDKLTPETKNAMEAAFPNVVEGIRNHTARWQYSNIYSLNIGGRVVLSHALDDASIEAEAAEAFDVWVRGTSADGFHEFNSPGYTPVTLHGLEAAWTYARDSQFRDQLKRTMDLITYQLALNMLPNGFLAGSPSRAYQNDALHGTSTSSAFYGHIKFGTPCPPDAGNIYVGALNNEIFIRHTVFDYVPPDAVRTLAQEKAGISEIHDRGVSLGSRRTHFLTPNWSLASQCLQTVGGHSPPSYILLVRNKTEERVSAPLIPDESFLHMPCATFTSRQEGARVVGRLHYERPEDEEERFLNDPMFYCEPRVLFGLRDAIQEVRIGNVDWGGGDIQLQPGQSVAVSYGDLYYGIVPLLLTEDGKARQGHARLAYGEDTELRLHLRLYGGESLQRGDHPLDCIVLVDVQEPGPDGSFAAFAESLSHWSLSQDLSGDPVQIRAEHPDLPTIGFPYTETDPDPIGDALHISPGLTLRPGDLINLVSGDEPIPF